MMNISTKEIAAGAFKATCLRLIDEVAERREEIVITKRGKPLAKLVPVVEEPPELVGWLRGNREHQWRHRRIPGRALGRRSGA